MRRIDDDEDGTCAYALATGEAAADHLRIFQGVYGFGTRRLLLEAGLRRGMRVADFGCGVGMVTAKIAEVVGPEGHVVGVDASGAQLAQARARLNGSGKFTSFVEASATDTGLPPGSFDLIYSRFFLIHLAEPERAAARECGGCSSRTASSCARKATWPRRGAYPPRR